MTTAFGLDLAGYSTTCSALAMAHCAESVSVTILNAHCVCVKRDGSQQLQVIADQEVECLRQMLARGPLYIDVPIDLQGLPTPLDATFVWQLIKRPVDMAFQGLCPLADRIGSCVARMQRLWHLLTAAEGDLLGSALFETYPAASLKLSGLANKGYKGHATYLDGKWHGDPAVKEADRTINDRMASMLTQLRWYAEDGFNLSNDEFDAAICALTGVGEQLCDDALNSEIRRRLAAPLLKAPVGYVLLRAIPAGLRLDRQTFAAVVAK